MNGAIQKFYFLPLALLSVVWALELTTRSIPILSLTFFWVFLGKLAIVAVGIFFVFAGALPWLIVAAGRWWGGIATHRQIANVVSLSMVPTSTLLTYQLLMLFTGNPPTLMGFQAAAILQLWTFALMVVGLATCQRFSYALALLNLVMAQLPLLVIGVWIARLT